MKEDLVDLGMADLLKLISNNYETHAINSIKFEGIELPSNQSIEDQEQDGMVKTTYK